MFVFSYIAVVKLSMWTIIFSSNIRLFFFQWAPFSVKMGTGNYTTVTEFIILGLAEDTTVCVILFIVFLGIYLVTLIGNISIIMLIRSSPQLHTPMYLFLCHLAFVDVGYSSSVTPVMLMGFLREGTSILVAGCIAQGGMDFLHQ